MRELPREEQSCNKPASSRLLREKQLFCFLNDRQRICDGRIGGAVLTGCSTPPHQRWNGSDNSSDPCVDRMYALERRVSKGIEPDVGGSQNRSCRVHTFPKQRRSEQPRGDCEQRSRTLAHKPSYEGSVLCTAHLGIMGRFE